MTRVFFLHGNPGHKSDWETLASQLSRNAEIVLADSYSSTWVQEILSSEGKVLIVAHSWGCYRLLSQLDRIFHKIERIFLINPYVKIESPLSGFAKGILNLPVVGDFLLKKNHKKSFEDFLNKMIYPQNLSDNNAYAVKRNLLSDSTSWKKAILGKTMQQESALPQPKKKALGYVYYGSQDKSQNNKLQEEALSSQIYLLKREFADGGHGLIWSHAKEIAQDINSLVDRIGYSKGESISNNVISFIEKHVTAHGDGIALKWADAQSLKNWDGKHQTKINHQQITFRELEDRIARFAQGLLDIGIQKGDRVIIFLPMSVDMYISMFAVQRIGAIAVFLDSWARSHHLGASAECVQPKAMISFNAAFQLVNQVPEFNSMPIRILYGPGEGATHQYAQIFSSKRSHIEPVESEFTALITFTTGSTGKPKGANRTHRFLVAQHYALTHVIPYTANDFDMPAFPIFSLNSLATGVSTLLPAINLAQPTATDSALLTNQIINEKVTCTTLSPSMLVGVARYCDENGIQLTNLRRVVTGGAPISKDDVRAFYKIAPQVDLWILYGSTEAEPMAHIEGRDMLKAEKIHDADVVENGVNVGEISEDIQSKFIKIVSGPVVLGKNGWKELEVAGGEVGEFICTGDHVCRDYYNNPEAFSSTKIMDEKGRVWHRTGDLAYKDSDHNLWIVGRVNNAIERKGKYYFPVTAEILLKRMNFTQRCAFLGLPASANANEQETCAVVELKQDLDLNSFSPEQAKKEIRNVFDKNGIPLDHIKFVKKIPMDPRHHSKVEYGVLRSSLVNNEEVLFV